jgi:carboxymethylenebutenolidase
MTCIASACVVPALLCALFQGQSRPASQPAKDSMTGGYTEAEFKALHELKGEKAPPPKGTTVEIAKARCYLSLPPGAKPGLPGVVVIHEWWGLNDHIKHWADRLAAEGYAALAVDLYEGTVATNAEEAMAAMRKVDGARALEVMKAAHEFLKSDPRTLSRKRGCVGWCFGGAQSLRMGLALLDLEACALYYGGQLTTEAEKLKAIKAAVFGAFGNQDRNPSPEVVNAFEKGLKEAQVRHEIWRYDAPHAFANPSNARYDARSAGDAWDKLRAFFARTLK